MKDVQEAKEEFESDLTKNEKDEYTIDNDGVITNLSEIKKQKESLIKIYKDFDELPIEILDDKIAEFKKEIEEHLQILDEMEANELKRQEEKRQEDIKNRQRLATHYIEGKPEVIKKPDDPKIPWSVLLWTGGIAIIEIVVIVIIFLLCK